MKTRIPLLTLAYGLGVCLVASLSAEDGKSASPLSAPAKPVPAPVPVGTPAVLPVAPLDGSFRQTAFFDVASLDSASTAFVAALAQNFETSLINLFPDVQPANSDGPRNIRIELLSDKNVPWPEPWRIVEKRGQWLLLVRWTRELELGSVHQALARALLGKLTQNHSDSGGNSVESVPRLFAPAVPDWLVDALLSEVEVRANPAIAGWWTLEARDAGPVSLEELGSTSRVRQGFWFLRHLQRELARKKISGSVFFSGLAGGGAPEEIFARHFPDIAADPDRRVLWWPTGFVQITRPHRGGPVLSMRESREYLETATAFVFAPAGVDSRFAPEDLSSLRHLPAVQSEIRFRVQRLKRDIASANPVWHNAWQSYGVFLERLLDSKDVDVKLGGWRYGVSRKKLPPAKPEELRALWKQVQTDITAARTLEEAINAALLSEIKKK